MSRRSSDLDPAIDPVAERLLDIGRHLRVTRQQRGEDLYDVADYLRIKPSYLFALEEGDLAAMPGRTYAMGFLRTYADHLGFDGAEVVRGLNATTQAKRSAVLKVREPSPENRLPSLAVVVAALVLAVVAYGGWFAAQLGEEVLARIRAVPGEIGQYAASLFDNDAMTIVLDDTEPQPAEMFVAGSSGSAAPPATSQPTVALPYRPLVVGSTTAPNTPLVDGGADAERPLAGLQAREVSADASIDTDAAGRGTTTDLAAAWSETAAIGRQPPSGGATAGTNSEDTLAALVLDAEDERGAALRRLDDELPDGGTVGELLAGLQPSPENSSDPAAATTAPVTSSTGRVVLLAREPSWIQVQSPSRDFLRSTTLEPGDRFEIPDRTDLALWTGNAGGVEIWVDGRNIGVLGQSGAVMRDVSLAPDALTAQR